MYNNNNNNNKQQITKITLKSTPPCFKKLKLKKSLESEKALKYLPA